MTTIVGIDPGPTYTGFTILENDEIVVSSTYKKPEDTLPPIHWAMEVAEKISEELKNWDNILVVGIEGAVAPQSHYQGKKNLLPPKYLVNLGLTAGVITGRLSTEHSIVIVRPGKNGSGKNYPSALEGRRPSGLAGVTVPGVRNHERSSYDVANQAELLLREGYKYDYQPPLFNQK